MKNWKYFELLTNQFAILKKWCSDLEELEQDEELEWEQDELDEQLELHDEECEDELEEDPKSKF